MDIRELHPQNAHLGEANIKPGRAQLLIDFNF